MFVVKEMNWHLKEMKDLLNERRENGSEDCNYYLNDYNDLLTKVAENRGMRSYPQITFGKETGRAVIFEVEQ